MLYLYCYTSPAANPMRDVFPVFSRNYVFFLHFSVKLIEKKTRKSCNSLLVHYNYKIRKLCKLIPFNRYSSTILAFFQNLFNCPAVSRKKKSGKIYNIKPVKKTTNHKLAYILYYCGSLKLKSSYCMHIAHGIILCQYFLKRFHFHIRI